MQVSTFFTLKGSDKKHVFVDNLLVTQGGNIPLFKRKLIYLQRRDLKKIILSLKEIDWQINTKKTE